MNIQPFNRRKMDREMGSLLNERSPRKDVGLYLRRKLRPSLFAKDWLFKPMEIFMRNEINQLRCESRYDTN